MRLLEQEGAEPDASGAGILLSRNSSEGHMSQKMGISKPCGKHRKKALKERTKAQTKMENKNPDVKFISEALVGSLTASTAEEDLLLEDQNVKSLKNRTWAVASPIDSFFSEIHQAKKTYVFYDSL